MSFNTPEKPAGAFRIAIELEHPEDRMDNILLNALREQEDNVKLKNIYSDHLAGQKPVNSSEL